MRHSVVVALFVLLSLLLCLLPVRACLNDRDSDQLIAERKQLPAAFEVIIGRFERNPPLFYEMRVQRVAQELSAHPERLVLYDDIAVALDRLGRDEEAIGWIEKKRSRLLPLTGPNATSQHEEWYRYYANAGTFWAHRWLRAGADRQRIGEMKRARDRIAAAIRLKPNAHFGRERYQLKAMEWIIALRQGGLPQNVSLAETLQEEEANQTVEGLSGLIVLGNAWESPDIFGALSSALSRAGHQSVSYLARLRCRELLRNGHPSLAGRDTEDEALLFLTSLLSFHGNAARRDAQYRLMRAEAEKWQAGRLAYLLPRLRAGRHPDTDPAFWAEYHPLPPPQFRELTPGERLYLKIGEAGGTLAIFGCSFLLIVGIACGLRWRRVRQA